MKKMAVWALSCAVMSSACGDEVEGSIWTAEEWDITATIEDDAVLLELTTATVHRNDFTHVTIRKEGWSNAYDISRSPSPGQPDRDWSRPHRFFGEFHPDTYLEGSLHDGNFKRPPKTFQTYAYRLPRAAGVRSNWPDERGSEFLYVTRGYSYADNNSGHPGFGPGVYEVEVYAWYTGAADDEHPAANGEPEVQYIHYEQQIVTTQFTIE